MCDGLYKVDPDFLDKLTQFKLFDPKLCYNTVLKTDINDEPVMREFNKRDTLLSQEDKDENRRSAYATVNVAHIFGNKLYEEQIQEMFDLKDNDDEFLCNFHNKNFKAPSLWIKGKEDFEIPPINIFFCAKHENVGKIESHLWYF